LKKALNFVKIKKYMRNIEIEVRSFISPKKYKDLERKLNKIAKFLKEAKEETVYCGKENIRIRRDQNFSYLILKSGRIHDDSRKEIEITFKRADFGKLKEVFEQLGFNINVIWFRKRKIYDFKGIKVFLDDTKGYGKIIELERTEKVQNKEKIHRELKEKLKFLGVKTTPKRIFEQKFKYYKNNWKKILKYGNK
jgi:predicted adenylyl cyclase CyaB